MRLSDAPFASKAMPLQAAPCPRLGLHKLHCDTTSTSKPMIRQGGPASTTSTTLASLLRTARLEGCASAGRSHIHDFAYTGFALTHRSPQRLCLGKAAAHPRLHLHRLRSDASPTLKAMPRQDGRASMTSPTLASLRCTARLKGYALAGRLRVHDFTYTGCAPMCHPPRRLCFSRMATCTRLRLHQLCSDVPPTSKAMPWQASLTSTTSLAPAPLRCAARLEGYASVGRPCVHDLVYIGFAPMRRSPRRLCLGKTATRPRLHLHRLRFDTLPALKAMPRLAGLASTTSLA